jgi:hypothetical protein
MVVHKHATYAGAPRPRCVFHPHELNCRGCTRVLDAACAGVTTTTTTTTSVTRPTVATTHALLLAFVHTALVCASIPMTMTMRTRGWP